LGRPQVLKYAREQKRAAIEALCLTGPGILAEVMQGQNEMARVGAVKCAAALRVDAVELEQRGAQRQPGLTIVVYQPATGEQRIAHAPPAPMLDVPAREAEPVPLDTEAE
jgi:hypothetical protein